MPESCSRRDFLALLSGSAAASLASAAVRAQSAMPVRAIPTTGETLPIIGLGSTRPVSSIPELGAGRIEAVVRTLFEHGGRVIDTWPRSADNDGAFGRIISQPDLRDELFVTINVEQDDRQAGIDQFQSTLGLYRRDSIDLVNVGLVGTLVGVPLGLWAVPAFEEHPWKAAAVLTVASYAVKAALLPHEEHIYATTS